MNIFLQQLRKISTESACRINRFLYPERVYNEAPKRKVVFIRHGESEFNAEGKFCGWYDAGLTGHGRYEAVRCGEILKSFCITYDYIFTSVLTRATDTVKGIECATRHEVPVFKSWRLNERHYGDLTGKVRSEAVKTFGADQVLVWRRSLNVPPPPIKESNPYYCKIIKDYDNPDIIPSNETLLDTYARVRPYWNWFIIPFLKASECILVVAHNNSLRALMVHLFNLPQEQLNRIEMPKGIPVLCTFDMNLNPIKHESIKFLGDEEEVEEAKKICRIEL